MTPSVPLAAFIAAALLAATGNTLAQQTAPGAPSATAKPILPMPPRAPELLPERRRPLGPNADAVFDRLDTNRDGILSREEFRAGWPMQFPQDQVRGRLRLQFNELDANRNGAIDPNEYPNLLLIKQRGAAAPPLSQFDSNGNGKLEFPEYVRLVNTLAVRQTVVPPAVPRKTP